MCKNTLVRPMLIAIAAASWQRQRTYFLVDVALGVSHVQVRRKKGDWATPLLILWIMQIYGTQPDVYSV